MSRRRLADELDAALEDLDRARSVLPERLAAMRLASTAWPAGASSDVTGRGLLVHWCWSHEREVERCHANDLACDGEPLSVSDPTGESAVSGDRARRDHELVERKILAVRRQADELVTLLARYALRAPTEKERRETLREGERAAAADECWSCARGRNSSGSPVFSPGSRRTSLADGESRMLCEWCRAWLRDVGSLPSVRNVEDHARGVRVQRPKVAS